MAMARMAGGVAIGTEPRGRWIVLGAKHRVLEGRRVSGAAPLGEDLRTAAAASVGSSSSGSPARILTSDRLQILAWLVDPTQALTHVLRGLLPRTEHPDQPEHPRAPERHGA
jgi:hypothetical protein